MSNLKYNINDRVKLKVDEICNGDPLEAGTKGKVVKLYEMSESYGILFDGRTDVCKMHYTLVTKVNAENS